MENQLDTLQTKIDISINSNFAIVDSPKLRIQITKRKNEFKLLTSFVNRKLRGDNTFFVATVPMNKKDRMISFTNLAHHIIIKHFAPIEVNMYASTLKANNFKVYLDKSFTEYLNYAVMVLKTFFRSQTYKNSNWYLSPHTRKLLHLRDKYQKIIVNADQNLKELNQKLGVHKNRYGNFYNN